MSETVINGIRLTLSGPDTLPLAKVLRDSPDYDGPGTFFTVTMSNDSAQPRSLPFDELQRNTILIYRNPETEKEIVDNATPPPKMDGAVESVPPGQSKSFQVVFEYPAQLAEIKDGIATLEFGVRWESDWLRDSAYAAGSYDWNESFELSRRIKIYRE